MTRITFIDNKNTIRSVDVENGCTIMEAALKNGIPGIDAECGGACSCATCHVYIDESWFNKIPAIGSMEEDMLDFASYVRSNSRLSCQIKITEDMDGIVVHTPERQG